MSSVYIQYGIFVSLIASDKQVQIQSPIRSTCVVGVKKGYSVLYVALICPALSSPNQVKASICNLVGHAAPWGLKPKGGFLKTIKKKLYL